MELGPKVARWKSMSNAFLAVFFLGACTAPNPARMPVVTESPPGLVEWCAEQHLGQVECFRPEPGYCGEWGCLMPSESCAEEGAASPWVFVCTRNPHFVLVSSPDRG